MKLISQGDKLDKYRAHFIEGKELDHTEMIMLVRYRRAMALLSKGETLYTTVKILCSEYKLKEAQVYTIVQDSRRLYGNMHELDKDGLRFIHYENYMRLARKAEQAGDFKAAKAAYDSAARLEELFPKGNKSLPQDPQQFTRPTTVIFSTDPAVLRAQQGPTEDIDYEEQQ